MDWRKMMKTDLCPIVLSLAMLTAVTGCKSKTPDSANPPAEVKPAVSEYKGHVVETINTGGYTYVQVDTGSEKIWAAAPEFQINVGDEVTVPKGMPMTNYYSKTLDRTFDVVYFVSNIVTADTREVTGQLPEGHPGSTQKTIPAPGSKNIDFSEIKKPKGGKTIAEIYSEKDELAGKDVTLRARVVKYNPNIMGKNWIHLRDGTGAEGANDLTVNTDTSVRVGDTVRASGVLVINRDFGYGYEYDVIIEDAKVTVE